MDIRRMLRIILLIFLVFLCARTRGEKPRKLTLGYLTGSQKRPNDLFYNKPGQSISGAITLAVKEINEAKDVLPYTRLEFIIAETYGEEVESLRQTVDMMKQNISAYIGPQETCIHEARLAAAFSIPMVSYFCTAPELSDKGLYPTFARTKPHDSQISMSVVSLLLKFNWRKVSFVYSDQKALLAETILEKLLDNGVAVTSTETFDGPYFADTTISASPFIKIVQNTYQTTRVYVMLADFYEFEGLLIALKLKGLLDTGEYIVVGVDSQQYDAQDPQKYIEGLLTERAQPTTVAAFQAFLLVAPAAPVYPWFANFTKIVNYYLEAPPFNFTNAFKNKEILKILRPEAAYLYDAVWIYARAAHMAIQEGNDAGDGNTIMSYIKGTTYKSAMGYMNRIDENGDSHGNFTLLARMPSPEHGGFGMYPVGTFLLNQNDTSFPTLELVSGQSIDWVGNGPPIDEPACGFLGEKCIPGPTNTPQIVGGIIGGLVFVMVVVGIIVYRNWRYEQELASLLWKIDYKDLEVKSQFSGYSGYGINRLGGSLRASMVSLNSQADLDIRQVFTQVGQYKGQIVAIKRINKKYIDLTRNVQKEMKVMRDLRHDNLNAFIGACVDPGNISIITEYCTKGSLQDILANDDVKLDTMFVSSLVSDLIRAMIFIHDCEIHSHGRLKSSNCVVDSRWVLKVTDYGLWEFKDGMEPDNELTEHLYYQSLLWTAPELLNMPQLKPGGTQKGDVYSFAIIMYEIHGRAGPYGDTYTSPKEIINNVMRMDTETPFRPRLSALSVVPKFVTDCIKDCWNNDPALRPDFKTIRRMMKPLQKGMKPNIFDNMMALMEKYASNLEEIVDERTDLLMEEKKKTDELLHQMLPRTVAEQLKLGKRVEAETFESVTIYFSDICGFTSMSSESSPMQVVDMLNDLYTTFDSIIENYDVYKVETIGDAYMVVSGLPSRNGDRHAGEIASMSLHLNSAIKKFKIRHRPNDTLELRIGIHTGPCVAGVVGLKMPRYCLFGDTVNTASRMESNGLPLKIHCSQACRDILEKLGGYIMVDRGMIQMKGKGEMRTFWVEGEDRERRMSRLAPPQSSLKSSTPKSPMVSRMPTSPALRHHRHSIDGNMGIPIGIRGEPEGIQPGNGKHGIEGASGHVTSASGAAPLRSNFMARSRTITEDDGGRLANSLPTTRRCASVKIKFNDDNLESGGGSGDGLSRARGGFTDRDGGFTRSGGVGGGGGDSRGGTTSSSSSSSSGGRGTTPGKHNGFTFYKHEDDTIWEKKEGDEGQEARTPLLGMNDGGGIPMTSKLNKQMSCESVA